MSRNLKNSKYWVDLAMKLTSKDVRPPKCVRDGIVKPIEEENMKDEYIIINKTAIQKRIEGLERLYKNSEKPSVQGTTYNKLSVELKQILSQSTPLIPEIKKAFDVGKCECWKDIDKQQEAEDHISNLKLDI